MANVPVCMSKVNRRGFLSASTVALSLPLLDPSNLMNRRYETILVSAPSDWFPIAPNDEPPECEIRLLWNGDLSLNQALHEQRRFNAEKMRVAQELGHRGVHAWVVVREFNERRKKRFEELEGICCRLNQRFPQVELSPSLSKDGRSITIAGVFGSADDSPLELAAMLRNLAKGLEAVA